MKKKGTFFRDVMGVFSSNIVALVIGLATSIIMTRSLGPELKGEYTSLIVIPGILSSFVMFGSRPSIIYHLSKHIFTTEQVLSALVFLFSFSSIFGILIFMVFYFFINNENYDQIILLSILIYIPSKLLTAYIGSVFLAKQQFKKANQLKWMTAFFTFLSFFIFVFLLKWSLIGAFISLLTGSLIVTSFGISQLFKTSILKIQFDKKVISSIIKLGFMNAIALVIIQLNFRVDIILMNYLSTKQEIGYYSLGVSIAEKLWQLPFAVGIVLTSRSAASKNNKEMIIDVSRSLKTTFVIVFFSCIGLFLIAPTIIPFLFGIQFEKSVNVIQSILPGTLFFVIVRVLSSSLAGIGKPSLILIVFIPALVLNVILNYLWIPKYGGIGAAWATNVSYISGAIFLLYLFARFTKTPLKQFVSIEKNDFNLLKKMREK
jgi:O-antigen/teichoic acid export membrane protein